jgi:hypothetical protein
MGLALSVDEHVLGVELAQTELQLDCGHLPASSHCRRRSSLAPPGFGGWAATWSPAGASAYHGAPNAVMPWPSVSPGFSSPW